MTDREAIVSEGTGPDHEPTVNHLRRRVVAVLVAVVLIGAGIAIGVLATRDSDGSSDNATEAAPDVTTATTSAPVSSPPPTVTGTRYRDEIFPEVTVMSDLQYGSAPGVDGAPVALMLDLYQPSGDVAAARPALVFVHGGGFSGGDKAAGPSALLAPMFAKLGYVTVSINYRLLSTDGCSGANGVTPSCSTAATEAVHDGLAAVRWLRANAATYRVDATRIGIGGESAGAIIATGVGVHADDVGTSGDPGYPSDVGAWVSISGGLPGGIFVGAGDAPGLLISGTADPIVPYQWSVETADALQRAGVTHVLDTLEGAGHVPWAEHGAEIKDATRDFFFTQLDVGTTAR
jgi:acetyl esterase/lipase